MRKAAAVAVSLLAAYEGPSLSKVKSIRAVAKRALSLCTTGSKLRKYMRPLSSAYAASTWRFALCHGLPQSPWCEGWRREWGE